MFVMYFDSVNDDLVVDKVDKVDKGSVFHDYVTACLNNLVAINAFTTLDVATDWLWDTHKKHVGLPKDEAPHADFLSEVDRLKDMLDDVGASEIGAWLPFEIYKHHHIRVNGQYVAVADSVEEEGDYGIILMNLEDVKEVKL